jgi:hypothetical protein
MPTLTITQVATPLTAVYDIPMQQGVLTHLSISTSTTVAKDHDARINAYIHHEGSPPNRPERHLCAGFLHRHSLISWYGAIDIGPDEELSLSYDGSGVTIITVAWSRLTDTFLKHMGEYQIAIIKSASKG